MQGKAKLNPVSQLYVLEASPKQTVLSVSEESLWGERLGHLLSSALLKIKKMVQDPQTLFTNFESCTPFMIGKATRLPKPASTTRAE